MFLKNIMVAQSTYTAADAEEEVEVPAVAVEEVEEPDVAAEEPPKKKAKQDIFFHKNNPYAIRLM